MPDPISTQPDRVDQYTTVAAATATAPAALSNRSRSFDRRFNPASRSSQHNSKPSSQRSFRSELPCVGWQPPKPGRAHSEAGTRAERFIASTPAIAFWLRRITNPALSRATDAVASELIVDAESEEYERRPSSRPQRPRPPTNTREHIEIESTVQFGSLTRSRASPSTTSSPD